MILIPQQESNDKKELKRKRVVSLSSVFSRALSVLTGRKIVVNVVEQPQTGAPAWSSTHEVWLNLSQIKDDFDARSITSLNGLNFHELGHLRYTPRNGSNLISLIKSDSESRKLWEAMNCLEDSRIENLLVAYLPSIKNWLTATIADYLLSDVSMMDRAFPLIYGRYYLPKEVRQMASDNYVNQNDLAELKSIIDEYTSLLLDNSNSERAFNLIKRFSELLENLPPIHHGNSDDGEEGQQGGCVVIRVPNPHGHSHRPTQGYESSSNRPASRKDQERDLEKVLKNRDVVIDVTPKESKEESSDTSDGTEQFDDASDAGNKSSLGNDFGDDFGDDFDGDFDGNFNNSGDNNQKNNPSSKESGDEAGKSGSNQQVTNALEDLLSDVLDDLSKEINQIAKQLGITELEGGNAKEPKRANYQETPIPEGLVEISRSFGRELERLRADYDPSWLRYRDTGKVNPLRYLRGDDYETIFDEWSSGRDDVTEIEAVILLDKSGSMEGDNADNAYKSMWAIKNALERVNARTTVCVFDYGTELLYRADDKAGTTIRDAGADGGTNPEDALLYAKRIFAETEKPIRILFTITDGAWDTQIGEQAITEMKDAGILTCQALIADINIDRISREYLETYRHNFELLTVIKSAKDILNLGKELVRIAIRRNLSKV